MIRNLVQDTVNQYHNMKHTYEVFQSVCVLSERVDFLSETDRSLLQIAALCHDFHHPGVSNASVLASGSFTGKELSYVRERTQSTNIDFSMSYNEMIHVHDSLQAIEKYLIRLFKTDVFKNIKTIITLILSTDITLHDKYMIQYVNKLGVMMLILKLADISHALRPFKVHLYWVFNHHRENHNEYLSLGDIAKDTLWFYNRYLEPTLFVFDKHFDVPELKDQYTKNKLHWKLLLASDVGT